MQSFFRDWSFDPQVINARLRARPQPLEFVAISLSVMMIGVSIWLHQNGQVVLHDFINYSRAGTGDFVNYYYAYWFVPVLWLISRLPFYVGYAIWGLLNIAGIWFGARALGGRAALALLTYQALYVLFYGQISGIIAAGLGLAFWGLANKRWGWAGLGLLLAAVKFQSGLIFGAALWLFFPVTWRERLKALIVPAAGVAMSLVLYPGWPLDLLETFRIHPANDLGSLSLWQWIGPWALLVWLPPILLRLPPNRRILMFAAATCLGMPYFQQADLVCLFILPVGWLPILGNLGFLYIPLVWKAFQFLAIIPILLYILAAIPFKPGRKNTPNIEPAQ